MSLFPAYAQTEESSLPTNDIIEDVEESSAVSWEGSPGEEAKLLLSDNELSHGATSSPPTSPAVTLPTSTTIIDPNENYYLDHKFDRGNLRVSTLYFPGRPEYNTASAKPVGAIRGEAVGASKRARRYYEAAPARGAAADAAEAAARAAAHQRLLAAAPHDEQLWLQYIQFLETFGGGAAAEDGAGAALAAAEAAETRCAGSRALRRRRLALARRALPADRYLALLQQLMADEPCGAERGRLWLRLLSGVARSAAQCSAPAVQRVAAAALRDRHPPPYEDLLYLYGSFLRAAGLWERLVLLMELLVSMNFPPAPAPPPDAPPDAERDLLAYEDEVARSGLPTWVRWARVERARAAAHWRPAAGAGAADDPERAPSAADVADLLLPVVRPAGLFALAVVALRLAKVPLLPGCGWAADALHGPEWAEWGEWADGGDECALLPPLEAALRCGAGSVAGAAELLVAAAEPPHGWTRDGGAGFSAWTEWLWSAVASGLEGRARLALLCWRMRWHALVLELARSGGGAGADEECRRVRRWARGALRSAGDSPLAFAEFARIERAAGAGAGRAARVALAALRAAPADAPPEDRLYMARVVREVAAGADGAAAPALWAACCAALGRAPPDDADSPPPESVRREAYEKCCSECAALEAGAEAEGEEERDGVRALLPAGGEWARARALLAPPVELHAAVAELAARARPRRRYWEEACEGAVWAAQARGSGRAPVYARALLPRHPRNSLIAYVSGRAPPWVGVREAFERESVAAAADAARGCPAAALAALLPPLLRAAAAGWRAEAGARALRALRRATADGAGAAEGALPWALRLRAEARAAGGRAEAALYLALHRHPQHKWLYAGGAAAAPAGAAALADLLLEKQLRLHALHLELQ